MRPTPHALAGTETATLPGARLWMRRLLGDLRAGRSCLCLFPQAHLTGSPAAAEVLLDELLHELGDFVLVPAPGDGAPARSATPVPPPPVWSDPWGGMEPILDYDDGLSAFSGVRTRNAAVPQTRAAPAPEVRREDPGYHSLVDRIVKELGDSASGEDQWHNGTEEVLDRLTTAPTDPATARVIVVRGWQEPTPTAATDLLRRLSATVKAAGLPPEQRPRLLVLATSAGLPVELPEQIAREDVGVHWWWGALGRLDTAIVVAMTRPRPSGPAARHQLLEAVAQATVVEVCGPFLDLAARLAVEWDGLPDGLPAQLLRLTAGPEPDRVPVPGPRSTEPTGAPLHPNASLRPEWDRGALDRWDGRLRRRPDSGAESERSVRTRIWLAQNHALLPLLDEAREQFTEVIGIRSRISGPELAALYGRRAEMELGAMWHAHMQGHARLSQPEADRLRTLRACRNKLAHRTALDNTALKALVHVLCS
ncbi:hypothetical protein [Streptomyces sp. SPB4]|uniref:hypothetical protein n=1 Tax=Streptomyces sp. SPB4 TaxID=2940553 RepID=UPI002475937E|nr:hypothetical protein [Streptomyces sp. SPB4]MDH6539746.1 hypothetical protein [Streptomyces sp. SPB4]